jgi:hypothetical protein
VGFSPARLRGGTLHQLASMLTILSIPKAFRGHVAKIQRNAFRSWTLLSPTPEIIIVGDDEGAAEACSDFGLRHFPNVERSEYGTPMVDSLLRIGQAHASYPIICLVNADVILTNDIFNAVTQVAPLFKGQPFLLIGSKFDIDSFDPAEFGKPGWQDSLRSRCALEGERPDAFEYFIFPKSLQWGLPPFPMRGFDNLLVHRARQMNIPVVDCSDVITSFHQQHDHLYFLKPGQSWFVSPEYRRAVQILGFWNNYSLVDANFKMTPRGLRMQRLYWRRFLKRAHMTRVYGEYLLKDKFHPWSYPLYVLARTGYRIYKLARRAIRRVRLLAPRNFRSSFLTL